MSRPRGSKNKVKVVEKVEPPKKEENVPRGTQGITKQVGHPVAIVDGWKPNPQTGIEPPLEGKKECKCSHNKEMHYGGQKGHCNTSGCGCLEFK